jgi:hypothetical protein
MKKAISSTTNSKTASRKNNAMGSCPLSIEQAKILPARYHCSMMTRREAIWIAAGIPLVGGASKEFWNEKDPGQWTKEETEQLLIQSPWSKPAAISFTKAAPGFGTRYGNVYGLPGTVDSGRKASSPLAFQAVIRWESARPIRLAEKNNAFEGSQFYVIAAIGDFPTTGDANEDLAAREQRREMLQEFTRLDRKGDAPIYLDRIESIATGIRFYFSRLDAIKESNKEITFTTKVGPLEFKAKFPLKDMVYRGKLEL